jgi:mono/diheme cytochrome c family protein
MESDPLATVVSQVTHRGGEMSAFSGTPTKAQIDAVARYVVTQITHTAK